MTEIYSYILRYDDGAAPNPFWGTCTLAICKPIIRRTAKIGDWVIGTGSKNAICNDNYRYNLSNCLVYAMKITDIMSMREYDSFCLEELKKKIPDWSSKDWRLKAGDSIYDYSIKGKRKPLIRQSVHNQKNMKKDLSGENVLLSNHFYYFGEHPKVLPYKLKDLVKINQGHRRIKNTTLVDSFEEWISQFKINKIYAIPQMAYIFQNPTNKALTLCAENHFKQDKSEKEDLLC